MTDDIADRSRLTPAHENPWYVLMTLYGEKDEEGGDKDWRRKNRAVWNAWSCQGLSDETAAELAKQALVDPAETRGWADIADEVKEKHLAEMEKRNKGADFTYPGFPDVKDEIRCSDIEFSNKVVLKYCIFTQAAIFSSATFTQGADFDSATFTRHANFALATFTQPANFDSATFTQAAYFLSATFTQPAYFYSATFTQAAYFNSATFTQDANFHSASFDGPAKFVRARFGVRDSADICVPDFTEASFARIASFREADFAHHYPVLEGTEFRESVVVTAKEDCWPEPNRRLLRVAGGGASPIPTYEVAKESCAALRHALAKQGRPEDEHFFFQREMRFAARAEPFLKTAHIRFYGLISDYGSAIMRPALFLFAVWGAGTWYYWKRAWFAGWDAAGYSFATMFKFFGLQRTFMAEQTASLENIPWGEPIAGTQTVLAFILLFFLGLGLRTRFRLR